MTPNRRIAAAILSLLITCALASVARADVPTTVAELETPSGKPGPAVRGTPAKLGSRV